MGRAERRVVAARRDKSSRSSVRGSRKHSGWWRRRARGGRTRRVSVCVGVRPLLPPPPPPPPPLSLAHLYSDVPPTTKAGRRGSQHFSLVRFKLCCEWLAVPHKDAELAFDHTIILWRRRQRKDRTVLFFVYLFVFCWGEG